MINIGDFYNKYFKPGNVCTDSRKLVKDDIFIALKGDNFNGNFYVEEALKSGACIAVIDDPAFYINENTFLVEDSLNFLHQLAKFHKLSAGFHALAITGTNGKTTTKELIRSALSEKFNCQATEGNLNNHIGVPLTLLSIQKDTEIAIIEMGANHPGEIKQLCEIAFPDSGLITNIGKAHLEGFGSFDGIKKTKAELYDFIKNTNGTIFFNASNIILSELIGSYKKTIAYNSKNDTTVKIVKNNPTLSMEITIGNSHKFQINTNLYGDYNFENILAAVCIGFYFGLETNQIICGIEKYQPENNRSQVYKTQANTLIIDCYNANPSSMDKAIHSFAKIKETAKILILGGMKELGEGSQAEHLNVIELLKKFQFEEILLTGEEFNLPLNQGFRHFPDLQLLTQYLQKVNYQNKHILIKGSRANKLEKIIGYL
jgi:UDP-N-acetylmuramoyl-tripeptide--D-alanyl-D-alanine ligase